MTASPQASSVDSCLPSPHVLIQREAFNHEGFLLIPDLGIHGVVSMQICGVRRRHQSLTFDKRTTAELCLAIAFYLYSPPSPYKERSALDLGRFWGSFDGTPAQREQKAAFRR